MRSFVFSSRSYSRFRLRTRSASAARRARASGLAIWLRHLLQLSSCGLQRDLQDLVDRLDRVERDLLANLLRNVLQVALVPLGQDDVLQACPVGGQDLLLQPS